MHVHLSTIIAVYYLICFNVFHMKTCLIMKQYQWCTAQATFTRTYRIPTLQGSHVGGEATPSLIVICP